MKAFWKEFLFRGLICAAGGPLVLAVIYGIWSVSGAVTQLTPGEVCLAIFTITLLAFIAAGMTAVYQQEQLPLPIAILLHGGTLYIAYLMIYLINGWLPQQLAAILVFTGIFVGNYAMIWLFIYLVNKRKADKLNKLLKQ